MSKQVLLTLGSIGVVALFYAVSISGPYAVVKYAAGNALITCLREHLTTRRGDRRAALVRFRDAMTTQGRDGDLRPLFEHIHVFAWIESRISGRPFAQVLLERARPMSEAA